MSAEQEVSAPESRPTPNDLYKAAQRLIRAGQPVFPCRSGLDGNREKAKAPLTKDGFKDATLDLAQVKAWWKRYPDAAIGIPTGIKWDVLDVDIKANSDGRHHLYRLQKQGLLNGCKRVIRTPSGGMHLYFNATPGLGNKGRAASFGLDVRGQGGYVIAPPSWIETPDYSGAYVDEGETVDSNNDPLLWNLILAEWAPFGIDKETKQPKNLLPSDRQASVAALREFVSTLQEGERNNGLFWAVSRCIENGIDPYELMDAALLTGLSESETKFTMDEALKRAGLVADELMTELEAMFPDVDDSDLENAE